MRTYFAVILMFTSVFLTGCDSRDGVLGDLTQQFDALIHGTRKKITSLEPGNNSVADQVSDEVGKLSAFEYKVVPLQSGGAASIEAGLNRLGRDRWDCFQIVPTNDGDSFVCKRAPQTYLRYIPRVIP